MVFALVDSMSVGNLLYVATLTPRILRWLLKYWKIAASYTRSNI